MNRRGFLLGLGASALVLSRAPTSYFFAPRAGWLRGDRMLTIDFIRANVRREFDRMMSADPHLKVLLTQQQEARKNGIYTVAGGDWIREGNPAGILELSLPLVGSTPMYRVTSVL